MSTETKEVTTKIRVGWGDIGSEEILLTTHLSTYIGINSMKKLPNLGVFFTKNQDSNAESDFPFSFFVPLLDMRTHCRRLGKGHAVHWSARCSWSQFGDLRRSETQQHPQQKTETAEFFTRQVE